MKILMLFPYAPQPPPNDLGGTKRNLPFMLELSKYHEVSVLSFGSPEEELNFSNAYRDVCKEIRFINAKRPRIINGLHRLWLLFQGKSNFSLIYKPSMQRAIDDMTSNTRFDVIHCCVQFFGFYRFPEGVPVTSDTHEVKYNLFRRTSKHTRNLFWKIILYLSYKFGKKEEIECCKKFDLLTTTTDVDQALFRKDLPNQNMLTVQNGAGDSFFEEFRIEPEPYSIVFTGLFTHIPNKDGMFYFLEKIFPLILEKISQAHLYVVGKRPPQKLLNMASDNVTVTGFVDDVRPYMAKSKVYIIPLLAGGGIRGKALEAMAMKIPIVTTSIGVEGIHLQHNKSAIFADTPEEFAAAVIRLLTDNNFRKVIANNAYETAVNKYTWEAKGKELSKALCSLQAN